MNPYRGRLLAKTVRRGLRPLCLTMMLVSAAAFTASAPPETGRKITIRVIDWKTGKPLRNVSVALNGPGGRFLENQQGKVVAGTTNKMGEVIFQLPSPPPARVGVFYSGGGTCHLQQCSSFESFATSEIFSAGVVASNKCAGPKTPNGATVKPGELVIFGKPWTGWQCAMQEIP